MSPSEVVAWVGGLMALVPIVGCYLWFWWTAISDAISEDGDPEGVLFMTVVSFIVGAVLWIGAVAS